MRTENRRERERESTNASYGDSECSENGLPITRHTYETRVGQHKSYLRSTRTRTAKQPRQAKRERQTESTRSKVTSQCFQVTTAIRLHLHGQRLKTELSRRRKRTRLNKTEQERGELARGGINQLISSRKWSN